MPSRHLLVLLAALAVALPITVATAAGGTSQLYAKAVPVCKTAAKGNVMTCDAMRLVLVKAGTLGARPYTPLRARVGMSALPDGASTIGPAGGLTPADLRAVYALSGTGSGQTVAIVDAYNDPNIAADLATFDTHYGLTCSGCLTVYNQSGSTSGLPSNDTTGWSGEETLDVQAVHGVCPSCHIDLVEANSPQNSDLATAANTAAITLHATEITNSYGGTETGATNSAYDHPGIVITASTGDHGLYDFDKAIAQQAAGPSKPEDPAAYPSVVAVGGTSLYLGQTATRQSETVWNDDGPRAVWELNLGITGAGGGGCSTFAAAPSWQTHVANWSSTACGTKRLSADVSAVADPFTGFDIYDSYSCAGCGAPGWQTIGGTSLASPVVASIYALAGGAHGVKYPALTLYGRLSSAYDVTAGGNGYCDGEGAAQCGPAQFNLLGYGILDCAETSGGAAAVGNRACDAAPGYDGPSGVGAPKGLTMFTKTAPTVTAIGPASATHGVAKSFTATVSDPYPGGTTGATYVFNWGDGSTTTGSSATVAHTYTTAGTKTITVTFRDAYFSQGIASASKTVQVAVG